MDLLRESPTARDVATTWLTEYGQAVYVGDVHRIAGSLLPIGWFRDVLTFTWDYRALEGTEKIVAYLQCHLQPGQISKLSLVEDTYSAPIPVELTGGVEAVFTFETQVALGRGYVRLARNGLGAWKASSVCMMMMDLKGYEEMSHELGIYGEHTLAWTDVYRDRVLKIEANPHVLIIGSGQTGLQIAARFKQMNISAIVMERNDRIGDNWRKRYPTLALHTVRNHHQLLYQPYPYNWPLFTPRDKFANWLESYANSQDLVVWTKSHTEEQPVYHDDQRRWDVSLNRNGQQVTIHPAHIVVATGMFGEANMISLANQARFSGEVLHGSQYNGGARYAGKRVIVVGAGNTGIDICQDLCFHQAESVTINQRSSTCVRSGENIAEAMAQIWPDGVPAEVGDFKFGSMPLGLLKKIMQMQTHEMWESDKVLHDKLRKGGIALNMGPEGQGQLLLVWERGGGYWIDKGGADLIATKTVQVKQGVWPTSFSETGLIFSDDTEVAADVVIFATGYANIRETSRKIFGDATINRTGPVYGLDEEGELRGSYRPTGHPGLWFGTGDFWNSRFMSKQLALQIKAIEVGLMGPGVEKTSSPVMRPSL